MHRLPHIARDRQARSGRVVLSAWVLVLLWLAPLSPAFALDQSRAHFDHATTGFELLGQHRNVPCEACHANAIFKGTPKDCAACHGVGTAVRATAKPASHILSTNQCQACHTPWAWNPAVDFDHTQARGSCSTCHNGVQAQGKGPTHIQTDLECDACHTTLSWAGATFTHVGVTHGCAACHDNVHARGTTATHVPIGTPVTACESCHSPTNYTTWNPGVINHAAVTALACASCHETANFQGMHPSTNTTAGDSRPNLALDRIHPATGDCSQCHNTSSFLDPTVQRPSNHIPTAALCSQCHTTAGNWALYDVIGVHRGVTGCSVCHGPGTGPFAGPPPGNTLTIVGWPGAGHIPVGSTDCNGSGCHSSANVNPGGFRIGTASISVPTLTVAGHATVAAGGVAGCQTCHQTAPYLGMVASTNAAAGDSRPSTTLDARHPAAGDCNSCHTTTPTFAGNVTAGKPANHIPTGAPCAQCHTTANDYAQYSSPGTHRGVTGCAGCHGASVAGSFTLTNPVFSIITVPGNHIAFGSADCNGSGCHSTANVTPGGGGFRIGTANISAPTLTVAGHSTIAAAGVSGCVNCHETATYLGMVASTPTTAGDSRPPAALDAKHPTAGDCGNCHVTSPTFANNLLPSAGKPSNHIPTTAPCAQCHTTSGNFAVYSVAGVHQGVTRCLACHGPGTGPFAGAPPGNTLTIVGWPGSSHFPIGSADCNGSGCHGTANVNPGGFRLGAASLNNPVLNVSGHSTVAAAGVAGCQTCHESAPYLGMIASTASAWADSRPQAFDPKHPSSGDCSGCHTTTPTFATNQSGGSAKPANHIPTSAPCAQCHTTPGNYAAYVMGATGHAGISSNCAQCHAYGLSFYNMAPPTLKEPASGATGHIPAVPPNGTTVIACELCHSPSVFTTFTGTIMRHSYVRSMTCMSCHEFNMAWQTNAGTQLWTRPDPGHHSGQDCGGSGCHSPRDKRALRPAARAGMTQGDRQPRGPDRGVEAPATAGPFNHATVAGTPCVSCHAAANGSGKPASHISSTGNCRACHTTLAWLPVRSVDHSQVSGSCVSCHNGSAAAGKPSRHIQTTASCERCHTTNGWLPARFDHAAVAPRHCNTCHNGVQAVGMGRSHIPTTQQCDTCHGTLAWKPALIDHSSFMTACARCHNNAGAVGLTPNHLATHLDCSSCHNFPDWSVIHFHHRASAYPGEHRKALTCVSCHTGNTEQVPYQAAAYAGACGGCHARDFVAAKHPKFKGQDYSVGELANCTGACHVYSNAALTTVLKSQPGPRHRVGNAGF
ncbi:MAG: hypothetical protein JSR67_04330 [Proteobacteria bacterium]|nr:hypothetical protein [Pseudomonadota bacterium]